MRRRGRGLRGLGDAGAGARVSGIVPLSTQERGSQAATCPEEQTDRADTVRTGMFRASVARHRIVHQFDARNVIVVDSGFMGTASP